jgi:hypothetical protein
VAGTTLTGTTVAEVMAELAALEDPKTREVNERRRRSRCEPQQAARAREAAEDAAGTRVPALGDG